MKLKLFANSDENTRVFDTFVYASNYDEKYSY